MNRKCVCGGGRNSCWHNKWKPQTRTKGIQKQTVVGRETDPVRIVEEIVKWYIHKTESVQENETHQILLFWATNESLKPDKKIRPSVN